MAKKGAAASASVTAKKKRSASAPSTKKKTIISSSPKLSFEFKSFSVAAAAAASSKKTLAPSAPPKTLESVSNLKDLASSGFDSLKRRLDLCHSDALKEIDSSVSKVSKRFKVQVQACLQLSGEAEKEYKKASDMINETTELMKTSYGKLIAEAQAAASRVRKVSIPELGKSMEKAVEDLRGRYKIPV